MLGKPHPSSRSRDLFLEVEIPAPGVGRDVVLRGLPVRAEAEGGEGAHRPAGGGGSVPEHGWRRSGRGAEGEKGREEHRWSWEGVGRVGKKNYAYGNTERHLTDLAGGSHPIWQ